MNHSLYSADRMTHLRIVVVALVAAIAVAAVGISSRVSQSDDLRAGVFKARNTVVLTSNMASMVR
ncbi:hypothetical protein [Bradyrhizobium sp. 2TAF24]|uniref:hypothetical protein n=1 Tax=Bradyrhizobium sp. 2TAF24 TaxID=3233011 RepID=UPI003F939790